MRLENLVGREMLSGTENFGNGFEYMVYEWFLNHPRGTGLLGQSFKTRFLRRSEENDGNMRGLFHDLEATTGLIPVDTGHRIELI